MWGNTLSFGEHLSLARVVNRVLMTGIDHTTHAKLTFALSTIISVNSLLFISFQAGNRAGAYGAFPGQTPPPCPLPWLLSEAPR